MNISDGPASLPVLLVDIDGVCSPLTNPSADRPDWDWSRRQFGWNRGWVAPQLAELLQELDQVADVVWCTGWGSEASLYGAALGVDWPYMTFGAGNDARHWKLSGIEPYIGSRPACWLDDEHNDYTLRWAEERSRTIPTWARLVDDRVGLTPEIAAEVVNWCRRVSAER